MKIGIAYLEYGRNKGIERISAEIADRLAGHGHEVHYFAARQKGEVPSAIRLHVVPTLGHFNTPLLLSFAFIARRALRRGRFDLTHSYGNVVGCDVITAQSVHRAGLETTGSVLRGRVNERNLGIADRIRLFLEHQNYGKRQYHRVIACSHVVKRELMKYYGVPEADISVISNGVDTEAFQPPKGEHLRSDTRLRYRIAPDDHVLLFVGHEFVRKGLETLIRSMALIGRENVRLIVCGGGPPKEFFALARELGVHEQLVFAGSVDDVRQYYAAGDIFVLPTLYEPFGLVITEAMASGLPVVVTKAAGAAEDIIEDRRDGVLISDPLDARELASAIVTLLDDANLRKTLGENARRKVQAYNWDACVRRVEEVYREVQQKFVAMK